MSERKPQPRKPNDVPVARGVSPPPVPIRRPKPANQSPKPAARRPAGPPPLPRPATRPASAPEFAFNDTGGRVVVRRHTHKRPQANRGWTLGVEIGAVAVLAGFFMAAGWYFLGRRTPETPPVAANARPEPKATKPAVVVEPAKAVEKPVEKPAVSVAPPAPPAPPPQTPVAHAPGSPNTPEKPEPPPMKPAPPKRTAPATTNLTFARDIFPMLKSKCWSCHGENKKKLKGGLDVSTLALLEKGGESGPALNRKDPETSPLWDTVASGQMPPGKSNKLTESEKKKLHDWIVGGGK